MKIDYALNYYFVVLLAFDKEKLKKKKNFVF